MNDDPDEALRMLDDITKPETIAAGLRRCSPSEAKVIFGFDGRGRVPAGMTIFESTKEGVSAWELAARTVAEYQESLIPPPPIEPAPAEKPVGIEGVIVRKLAYGR